MFSYLKTMEILSLNKKDLFVCFITKSFLTYSLFFPPSPASSTISMHLSSSMCSITPETANVGSNCNRMRGPVIGCWFTDRSNCSLWSLTLAFTLTNENLSYIPRYYFYWSLLLSHKVEAITAEVCTVAAAIASASVGDVPVGYSSLLVDLAS